MGKAEDVLKDFGRAKSRDLWNSHFQDLVDYLAPNMMGFTRSRIPGERRTTHIYDGTPLIAVRGMVSAIDGMLKPKTSRWMDVRAVDDELNENDSVKRWMEEATNITLEEFYRPKARFIQATGETDRSLVVLGSGVVFINESRTRNGLLFRSMPLSSTYFRENSDGDIDTLYWHTKWPARVAQQYWPDKDLGKSVKEALEQNRPDDEFEFVQAVRPRDQRDPEMVDPLNMPWEYLAVAVADQHVIDESGFMEWPFATPRWDTESGETYGRSPGMLALPDSKTLQQQGKTMLRAGHLAVEPPMMAPHESIVRGPSLVPGGMTYYNAQALRTAGLTNPIQPLFTGAQLPLGREMQQDTRDQIFAAFFRNVLNLPIDGPQMTATEVIERKEEFVRTIGPVFGRLEADYMAPMVERAFSILLRQGKFPDPPEELQGRQIRFEFASPVEKVRKQIDTLQASESINTLEPFIAADPTIMDNFDGDKIARATGETNMPQDWLRPTTDVEEIRARRREQIEREARAQAVERASAATETLSKAAQ